MQREQEHRQDQYKHQKNEGKDCLDHVYPVSFHSANTSVSPSDIWEFSSTMTQERLFCKVFASRGGSSSSNTDGLEYECEVYTYIRNMLRKDDCFHKCFVELHCIKRNLSFGELSNLILGREFHHNNNNNNISMDNIIRNLLIIQCGNPRSRPALHSPKSSSQLTEHDIPKCFSVPIKRNMEMVQQGKYNMIITKRPKGNVVTLYDFVHDQDISTQTKCDVLGKTMLAIHKMHSLYISHNDMIWTNILVSDRETSLVYTDESILPYTYTFTSKYVPILFDWDRAQTLVTGSNNTGLDTGYGSLYKPKYAPHRDIILFFVNMLRYQKAIFQTEHLSDDIVHAFFPDMSVREKEDVFNIMLKYEFWTFATEQNLDILNGKLNLDLSAFMDHLGISYTHEVHTLENYVFHGWCKETYKSDEYMSMAKEILKRMGLSEQQTNLLNKHELCAEIKARSRRIIDDTNMDHIVVQVGSSTEIYSIQMLALKLQWDPLFRATCSDSQQRHIYRLSSFMTKNVPSQCSAFKSSKEECEARSQCEYKERSYWQKLFNISPNNQQCSLSIAYLIDIRNTIHDVELSILRGLIVEIYATNVKQHLIHSYKDKDLVQQQEYSDNAWKEFDTLFTTLYRMKDSENTRRSLLDTIDEYIQHHGDTDTKEYIQKRREREASADERYKRDLEQERDYIRKKENFKKEQERQQQQQQREHQQQQREYERQQQRQQRAREQREHQQQQQQREHQQQQQQQQREHQQQQREYERQQQREREQHKQKQHKGKDKNDKRKQRHTSTKNKCLGYANFSPEEDVKQNFKSQCCDITVNNMRTFLKQNTPLSEDAIEKMNPKKLYKRMQLATHPDKTEDIYNVQGLNFYKENCNW